MTLIFRETVIGPQATKIVRRQFREDHFIDFLDAVRIEYVASKDVFRVIDTVNMEVREVSDFLASKKWEHAYACACWVWYNVAKTDIPLGRVMFKRAVRWIGKVV